MDNRAHTRKDVPHMSLRLSNDPIERRKTLQAYYSANRKGKRDLLRKQKAEYGRLRAEGRANGCFGLHPAVKRYNERTEEAVQIALYRGISIRHAQADRAFDEYVLRVETKSAYETRMQVVDANKD